MPLPVISVENLSKRYLLGHRAEQTMDECFPNFLREPRYEQVRPYFRILSERSAAAILVEQLFGKSRVRAISPGVKDEVGIGGG